MVDVTTALEAAGYMLEVEDFGYTLEVEDCDLPRFNVVKATEPHKGMPTVAKEFVLYIRCEPDKDAGDGTGDDFGRYDNDDEVLGVFTRLAPGKKNGR
jgi:hypothetical protein